MYDHDQPLYAALVVIHLSSHGLSVLGSTVSNLCAEAGPCTLKKYKALLYAERSYPNTKLADYANQ